MAAPLRPVPPQPAPRRPPPTAPLGHDTSDVLQQIMAITDQSLDEAQARCGPRVEGKGRRRDADGTGAAELGVMDRRSGGGKDGYQRSSWTRG